MLDPTLSLNEMRQKVYELRRKVGAGIGEVREYSRTSSHTIPQDAVRRYREFEKKTSSKTGGTAIRYMSEKQLREAYRDLEYIQHLKTSTLEGAIQASYTWTPKKEIIDSLSDDMKDKFWKLYEMLVSNEDIRNRYKYDIMNTAYEMITSGFGQYVDDESFRARLETNVGEMFEELTLDTVGLEDYETEEAEYEFFYGDFIERATEGIF